MLYSQLFFHFAEFFRLKKFLQIDSLSLPCFYKWILFKFVSRLFEACLLSSLCPMSWESSLVTSKIY